MGGKPFDPRTDPDATLLLHGALVCNDAKLEERSDEAGKRSWQIVGDPTEGAMVVAAAKSGYRRGDVEKALPRIQEIPFDSDRKRMTTIHSHDGAQAQASVSGFAYPPLVAFVKGAPDVILDLCGHRLESRPGRRPDRGHAQGDTRAEPRHGEQRAAGARSGLSPVAGSPGKRNPGNRREGSHFRRAARHDRPAAAGGGRGD